MGCFYSIHLNKLRIITPDAWKKKARKCYDFFVRRVKFSPASDYLIAVIDKPSLDIFNLETTNLLTSLNLKSDISQLKMSHDGKYIAFISDNTKVSVYDVKHDQIIYSQDFQQEESLRGLAFSPDGNFLLVGGINLLEINLKTKKMRMLMRNLFVDEIDVNITKMS